MSILDTLISVEAVRPSGYDPIRGRRRKLAGAIDNQLARIAAELAGTTFKKVVTKRYRDLETDMLIRAEESELISAFDDMSLIQLIVERGAGAVDALPKGIRESKEAVAETIENNVRKLIIDETPINPKYYETMSGLLDALIEQRKQQAIDYEKYLAEIVALTKKAKNPAAGATYPAAMNTAAKRALYDNLGKDEALATALDAEIRKTKKDDWRGNKFKEKEVRNAIWLRGKVFSIAGNAPSFKAVSAPSSKNGLK